MQQRQSDHAGVTRAQGSGETGQGAAESPEIIYIMGASRSGSTILGVILDQVAGNFYAGELCEWPERAGVSSAPKSRGLWDRIRGGVGSLPAGADRFKRVFEHPRGLLQPVEHFRLRRQYHALTEEVVAAVRAETGCTTIIDSSHYPRRARTLRKLVGADKVRLVFMVRRPSAVARSFRSTRDKGTLASNLYLFAVSLLSWATYLTHPRSSRVRIGYEALTRKPQLEGSRALGRDLGRIDFSDMAAPMVLIGNRLVKSSDRLELRPAPEPQDLTLVERLTDFMQWPLLLASPSQRGRHRPYA